LDAYNARQRSHPPSARHFGTPPALSTIPLLIRCSSPPRLSRSTSESLGSATVAARLRPPARPRAATLATAPVQKCHDKRAEPLHLKSTIDSTNWLPQNGFCCRTIEDANV